MYGSLILYFLSTEAPILSTLHWTVPFFADYIAGTYVLKK